MRLAETLAACRWEEPALIAGVRRALTRRPRSLIKLIPRLIEHCGTQARPASPRIARFLLQDAAFRRACGRDAIAFAVGRRAFAKPAMCPAAGAPSAWGVPPITTPQGLARFLGIGREELEWLADRQARERRQDFGQSRRYAYRWIARRSGFHRLIESPCPRLRFAQRQLLREVIDRIPPHEAAHGFRRGRSIRSYVLPHVGHRVVLKLDLSDFFATIASGRVLAIFLHAGYPEPVARLMAGLCTNTLPSSEWTHAPDPRGDEQGRRLYRRPHLPQGASTSPAMANLAAHRLDRRLSGLAGSVGATYTRYADDLLFSGDVEFERAVRRLPVAIMAIAMEEGFAIHPRKTRIMRRGTRQFAAGVVMNRGTNVPRDDFDRLKATLHNCRKHGPHAQDREGRDDFRSHLMGRIAHVNALNPDRGKKLRAIFDQVAWPPRSPGHAAEDRDLPP